jgi:hypothetical protein
LSEYFQKTLHCEKDRRFQISCQPSGRRVIPSGRPSVHCSIRLDDMFIPTGRQTDQHHPSGRHIFSVRTLHCVEKLLFQLASVRTSQQPVRTSISDRSTSDSFQVRYMGRLTHCPNDVVSRPDAIINKVLVFWPHSVFGQNHLYVRMLQTGIPLFRVKSEEFQSSLSAVRTMCHPVRTPICLLLHPSGRCVIPSGH